MKKTTVGMVVGVLLLLSAPMAAADTVTVGIGSTSPGQIISVNLPGVYVGQAWAGVENLTIEGVPVDAFCIDLSHLAPVGSTLEYTIDPLAVSPTAMPPGAMGPEKANFIKEMWAEYYADALKTNDAAAGFQLAIWGVLMGDFSGGVLVPDWTWLTSPNFYRAEEMIGWTNDNIGELASVSGLNPWDANAQAYAIPGVPDGGTTLMLLGGALVGLGALRRRFGG